MWLLYADVSPESPRHHKHPLLCSSWWPQPKQFFWTEPVQSRFSTKWECFLSYGERIDHIFPENEIDYSYKSALSLPASQFSLRHCTQLMKFAGGPDYFHHSSPTTRRKWVNSIWTGQTLCRLHKRNVQTRLLYSIQLKKKEIKNVQLSILLPRNHSIMHENLCPRFNYGKYCCATHVATWLFILLAN